MKLKLTALLNNTEQSKSTKNSYRGRLFYKYQIRSTPHKVSVFTSITMHYMNNSLTQQM